MLITSAQQTEQAGKIYKLTPLMFSVKIPNSHRLEEKNIKAEFFSPVSLGKAHKLMSEEMT